MEPTDWHELGEERFLRGFADKLNHAVEQGRFERLILAAPPKVLGRMRPVLSAKVADLLAAEVASDLTGQPVDRIEQHLAKALAG